MNHGQQAPILPYHHEAQHQMALLPNYYEWTLDRLNTWIGSRILDVGSGVGNLAERLSGWEQLVLLDVNPAQCEEMAQRFKGVAGVNVFCQDILNPSILGLGRSAFDTVICLDVLEHLPDYFRFLAELRDKGRHKIFHIPLDLSVQTVLRKDALLKRRDMYGHLHFFTKETALEALRDTGYEILDWFYTPRANSVGAAATQRLLKLPRKLLFALHEDVAARVLGGYSLLVLAR